MKVNPPGVSWSPAAAVSAPPSGSSSPPSGHIVFGTRLNTAALSPTIRPVGPDFQAALLLPDTLPQTSTLSSTPPLPAALQIESIRPPTCTGHHFSARLPASVVASNTSPLSPLDPRPPA